MSEYLGLLEMRIGGVCVHITWKYRDGAVGGDISDLFGRSELRADLAHLQC